MTKNPFLNALAAIAYIALVSSLMFFGTQNARPEDSVLAPIMIISLFTLSAAVMGYIFLYNPFRLYFDGQKKEALNLFLQTLGTFAVIVAIVMIISFILIH